MKKFSELGVTAKPKCFIGEKIKVSKILNKEITVIDYKIMDSKFEGKSGKCLHLQIEINNEKHIVFTGSTILMDMIQEVSKDNFPFITTIVNTNEYLEFT